MSKYVTRSSLLPEIKRNRRNELGESFTGKSAMAFEMTTVEYLAIVSIYQLNVGYILVYMDLVAKHGAIVVTMFYVFLTAIFGMPLFMLFTFMSSYSGKSYFTFWKCVPLFQGLGYGLAVLSLVSEMHNITMSSLALLLLFSFFTGKMKKGIINCAHNTTYCVKMYPAQNMTISCWNSSKHVVTATQNYMSYISTKYSKIGVESFNVDWLLLTGFSWIVVLILSVFGFRYIKQVVVIAQVVCGTIMLFVSTFGVSYVPWSTIKKVEMSEWKEGKALFQFHFWVDLLLHSAEINILANMIWLGTLKPKTLHPKYAAVIISSIKVVIFILFLCLMSCLLKENIVHYKFVDPTCFRLNPRMVLFTLVPDVLFRTKVYNLYVPLWYLCLFVCSVCTPIYSTIGLVDSFLQKHTRLCKYRIYLIIAFCVIGFFYTAFTISKRGYELDTHWRGCVVPLWTSSMLLVVSLAIFFVYSTRTVIEDYLFIYGITPERYWIAAWRSTPILAVLIFILVVHNQYTNKLCVDNTYIILFAHAAIVLALLPIILMFLTKCFKHVKCGTIFTIARPDSEWGPSDRNKKIERAVFYPQRDMRYRSIQLKCRHNCITENCLDFHLLLLSHRRGLNYLERELERQSLLAQPKE